MNRKWWNKGTSGSRLIKWLGSFQHPIRIRCQSHCSQSHQSARRLIQCVSVCNPPLKIMPHPRYQTAPPTIDGDNNNNNNNNIFFTYCTVATQDYIASLTPALFNCSSQTRGSQFVYRVCTCFCLFFVSLAAAW